VGRFRVVVCAVVVAFAVLTPGLLGASPPQQVAGTMKPPRGYSTVTVTKAGLAMALPAGWVQVDLTRRPVDSFLRRFKRSDPKGAALLTPRRDFLAANGLFAAFDPRRAKYSDVVTVAATTGGSPFIPTGRPGEVQAAYAQNLGLGNSQVADATLAGAPAAIITSTADAPTTKGRSTAVHHTGYLVATKDGSLQIDYSGRKDPNQDKTLQTIVGHVLRNDVTVPYEASGTGTQQGTAFHGSGPSTLGDTTFNGTYGLLNSQPPPCGQGPGVPLNASNNIATANGDVVNVDLTGSACQSGSHVSGNLILFEYDSTGTYTIKGGTGCFTNASGSGQTSSHSAFNDPNTASLDATSTGTITLKKRPNCPYFQG